MIAESFFVDSSQWLYINFLQQYFASGFWNCITLMPDID